MSIRDAGDTAHDVIYFQVCTSTSSTDTLSCTQSPNLPVSTTVEKKYTLPSPVTSQYWALRLKVNSSFQIYLVHVDFGFTA